MELAVSGVSLVKLNPINRFGLIGDQITSSRSIPIMSALGKQSLAIWDQLPGQHPKSKILSHLNLCFFKIYYNLNAALLR